MPSSGRSRGETLQACNQPVKVTDFEANTSKIIESELIHCLCDDEVIHTNKAIIMQSLAEGLDKR